MRSPSFDLYSCFPSAVEVACEEFGLAEDDPRGLTVTGGLPYFGGPGNNYVTHAIAEMVSRVRAAPGRFGMVTANGNFLTKHAFGIYGTTPWRGPWRREPAAGYQAELDARPTPPLNPAPEGRARIETYTVMHGRGGAAGARGGHRPARGDRGAVPRQHPGRRRDLRGARGRGRSGAHGQGRDAGRPQRVPARRLIRRAVPLFLRVGKNRNILIYIYKIFRRWIVHCAVGAANRLRELLAQEDQYISDGQQNVHRRVGRRQDHEAGERDL